MRVSATAQRPSPKKSKSPRQNKAAFALAHSAHPFLGRFARVLPAPPLCGIYFSVNQSSRLVSSCSSPSKTLPFAPRSPDLHVIPAPSPGHCMEGMIPSFQKTPRSGIPFHRTTLSSSGTTAASSQHFLFASSRPASPRTFPPNSPRHLRDPVFIYFLFRCTRIPASVRLHVESVWDH